MQRTIARYRPLVGSGQTIADHDDTPDLCPDRLDRRRPDDFAAGAPGRRTELGLPLLLAAGRHLHALGVYESRILRRSEGVARLADARHRRQPAPGPDHVRGWWRAMVAGDDRSVARRLREIR